MKNEVKVLESREILNNIVFNIYGTVDEPLFLAKDVASVLGERNGADLARKVDEDEKLIRTICVAGQNRQVVMLTEDGIFEAFFLSRKPIAKQFKREVKLILKQIRKTGGYIPVKENETEAETILKAMNILQATIAKKDQLLEIQKPKVLFANSVESSRCSILIGELATLIKQNGCNIGQNKLFAYMRDNAFLCNRGERRNLPTQKSLDLGLFEIKERTINNPDGSVRITLTTKVTGKGQVYFVNKFLS